MRKSLHRYAQRAFITAALAATGATQLWANPGDVVFSETFDSKEALDNWKIVDKNGGRTWEWLRGAAAYMLDYQTGLPGDDWLILTLTDFTLHFSCCFTEILHSQFNPLLNNFTLQEKCY